MQFIIYSFYTVEAMYMTVLIICYLKKEIILFFLGVPVIIIMKNCLFVN